MALHYAPLFSGSSGNCTYVGNESDGLLIDAGVSAKRILDALSSIDIDPATLRGILVTHEHSDHITAVRTLSNKLNIPVFATEGTFSGMESRKCLISQDKRVLIQPGIDFFISGFQILPFSTPHDAADPCGYSVILGGSMFTLATDIGCVRDEWFSCACESGAVLLESNYDPDMLKAGPYPYDLKKRILSRKGHLSNDDAASVALKLAGAGVKHLILGHLSKENNFPELALRTSELVLTSNGVSLDEDIRLCVASRECVTGLFSVNSGILYRWR